MLRLLPSASESLSASLSPWPLKVPAPSTAPFPAYPGIRQLEAVEFRVPSAAVICRTLGYLLPWSVSVSSNISETGRQPDNLE